MLSWPKAGYITHIGETEVDPSHLHDHDLQCVHKCTEETLDKEVKRGRFKKSQNREYTPAHKQIHQQ